MTYQILSALILFAFVSSITPGPNNLMLMASGANFGLLRTLPHMLGVALGFVFMAALLALGLTQIFALWPPLHVVLKAVSAVFMLWLAWKIAHAAPPGQAAANGRPLSFLQAAAFQWVNPKAWAMATTAIAAYAPPESPLGGLWVALVFGAVNLPSISTWVMMGRQIRGVLTSPRRLALFNWTMAALLVASLWPILRA
ncbi:lysine transporter LysE [Defluviimonas sp. 20V17]|uniref:Lysine transporter LysE n=1 Tax=Allgaiera indica TaxID=765699 RepID=A0AAN4ZYA5_9RHOB|nr:LysE family translocator [Allgaiera indica]KDB02179.1 lysine transporter LysE [Defluviimonas sp. 20V17]GHD98795.1 lysine transporter LysE [Allgaiera indica]SDW05995.1 Threonine/homoserine/homoserine lactone efflux protein [Allgaiera indica]